MARKLCRCTVCPCESSSEMSSSSQPAGEDCTECAAGTTPLAFNVTFSGIANQTCGSSAYYNDTFRFEQREGSPCVYDCVNSPPDVWGGPCSIGPTHIVLGSTSASMDIGDTGLVNASATKAAGGNCMTPLNFAFTSLGVGPPAPGRQLNWSGMTAVAVPTT